MSEQLPRGWEPGSGVMTAMQRSRDMPDRQPQAPRDTQPVGRGPRTSPRHLSWACSLTGHQKRELMGPRRASACAGGGNPITVTPSPSAPPCK